MSYLIGSDLVSTWGALRAPFANNTIYFNGVPYGARIGGYQHTVEYVDKVNEDNPHTWFLTDGNTMFRIPLNAVAAVAWPIIYQTGQPPTWTGYIQVLGLDNKDFEELVGGAWATSADGITLESSANTDPGQYVETENYDYGVGFTEIEKMVVMP